jgi:hypothetical protein
MKGKLETLTVKEYNDDLVKKGTFKYLESHKLQGKFILVAPFFAELETDEGLIMSDEEEYIDEETFKAKVRQRESKAIVEKAIVVKIAPALKTEMKEKGFDFAEGDIILFDALARPKEYKVDRTTLSYEDVDHYILKLNLHEVETVLTK